VRLDFDRLWHHALMSARERIITIGLVSQFVRCAVLVGLDLTCRCHRLQGVRREVLAIRLSLIGYSQSWPKPEHTAKSRLLRSSVVLFQSEHPDGRTDVSSAGRTSWKKTDHTDSDFYNTYCANNPTKACMVSRTLCPSAFNAEELQVF
jgi:hypothetical protein